MTNLNLRYMEDRETIRQFNNYSVPECVKHLTHMQEQAFNFLRRNKDVLIRAGRRQGKTTLMIFKAIEALTTKDHVTVVYICKSRTRAIEVGELFANQLDESGTKFYLEHGNIRVGNNLFICTNIGRNPDEYRGFQRISDIYVDDIDLFGFQYVHALFNEWLPRLAIGVDGIIITATDVARFSKDTLITDYLSTNLSHFHYNEGTNDKN